MHALANFLFEHKTIANEWFEKSNYLCFLAVKNVQELIDLVNNAMHLGIKCSLFCEPDIDNQLTAIALAPGKITKELCKKLKLALPDI